MRLVEAVGNARAARAALVPFGRVHEVVHDELRPAVEQVTQRRLAVHGVESIVLLHAHPWQLASLTRQLVAQARELLLGLEELEASVEPLGGGSGAVLRHRSLLLLIGCGHCMNRSSSSSALVHPSTCPACSSALGRPTWWICTTVEVPDGSNVTVTTESRKSVCGDDHVKTNRRGRSITRYIPVWSTESESSRTITMRKDP